MKPTCASAARPGAPADLVDRLLTLGRVDEAARETQRVDDLAFLGLADRFLQHGQEAEAERLVRARIQEKPALHLLEWLQKYYRTQGQPRGRIGGSQNAVPHATLSQTLSGASRSRQAT